MFRVEPASRKRICSFIGRVERRKFKALDEGKKEVPSDAKAVKVLREILRCRKQDKEDRDEQDSQLSRVVAHL
jgi:uncharacterized protein (UPF0335 family)